MLHVYHICEKDMSHVSSGCLGDWPKAKKSKTSKGENYTSHWEHLPTVILHEIFSLLNQHDRVIASSVCKAWRYNLFHPSWWQNVTFVIEPQALHKAEFQIAAFGSIVCHARVKFYSLSPLCVAEFLVLLQRLNENNNLRSLIIEPSHCRIEQLQRFNDCNDRNDIATLIKLLENCCQLPLERFSFGAIEEVSPYVSQFLKILAAGRPEKVTHLGLASVKDEPGSCQSSQCDLELFTPFKNLQVLSIDYNILNDDFLNSLKGAKDLKRLVVHMHGINKGHPGTSEDAWIKFKGQHEGCELRISLIHAFEDVYHLQNGVLKQNMPLSHLKVFFCEYVNIEVLALLSSWYQETFKSIVWVDSQCQEDNGFAWNIARPFAYRERRQPDPIIAIAWLCSKLEEVVLLGYKYYEEELIAIARLRSDTLKVLEVAAADIIFSMHDCMPHICCKEEVSKILKKPWAPLEASELHPVICDPTAGDSDEYLLPKVLADIN